MLSCTQNYFTDLGATSEHLHRSQLVPERRWVATPTLTHCPMSPCLQVYDTPPMAVKGPNGQDPGQEIYDVPPSVEKNLHQTVSAAGKFSVSLLRMRNRILQGEKFTRSISPEMW